MKKAIYLMIAIMGVIMAGPACVSKDLEDVTRRFGERFLDKLWKK